MANQDKQHEASARQRQTFADRGEVARSRDLVAAVVAVVAATALVGQAPTLARQLVRFLRFALGQLQARPETLWAGASGTFARSVLPLGATCAAAALGMGLLQARGLSALQRPKFDLSRLNPIPRLGQLFGLNAGLATLALTLGKVAVLATVCALTLQQIVPASAQAAPTGLYAAWGLGMGMVATLARRALGVLLLLGLADYGLAYWKMQRRMRMSHQELRDEQKEEAGDPRVRLRRRRLHRELAKQRSLQDVPRADVVLVNPTHFAVALSYDSAKMAAPRLLAKGADADAERIRALARRHGVPVVSQPPLTRLLYRNVRVGKNVPAELYQAVAVVLAHVYRLRRRPA